ncbi:MAG: SMI1/KNR4 family protein [Ruminococcus sp.]|nr:SMI1/KNR4 family protein [Ruminococcus sp.]
MSYIPEIPNNSLTENLKKLIQLTQQLNDEYSFYYSPPLSETEIAEIERTNNISLPSSYKEWLMFSNEATICGAIAEFYDIKKIIKSPNFVHGDTVIIGSMIGDGEIICFSKSDGIIFTNDHEEIYEVDSFDDILLSIIEQLQYRA